MRYQNAAEILPERLVKELQTYLDGELLYIPKASTKKDWGADSGSRAFYRERNQEIKQLYAEGTSMDTLAKRYRLAESTIKKIIYG